MLAEMLHDPSGNLVMELAQAAAAIALCAAVVLTCRRVGVRVERKASISIARGLVQMVLVGIVLALLLKGSALVGAIILLLMTVAAAVTAARRARGIDGAMMLSFWSIAVGSGVVIAAMLLTGTLSTSITMLVPVGSM